MITIQEVEKRTLAPFCLITAQNGDETNIMANSWWTVASHRPPSIIICIGRKSLTNELIKKTEEFGLNLVPSSMADAAMNCGTTSGRTVSKAEEFKIPLVACPSMKTKLIADSLYAIACKVSSSIEVGDHTLFVGEVQEIINKEVNELPLYAANGYRNLVVPQVK